MQLPPLSFSLTVQRERERKRKREGERIFFNGMNGALAPFSSYLVKICKPCNFLFSEESTNFPCIDYSEKRSLPISVPDYKYLERDGERFVVSFFSETDTEGDGSDSTFDLLVLTSLDQMLLMMQTLFNFCGIQATSMRRSIVPSHPL
jgi:hypothetical protein